MAYTYLRMTVREVWSTRMVRVSGCPGVFKFPVGSRGKPGLRNRFIWVVLYIRAEGRVLFISVPYYIWGT